MSKSLALFALLAFVSSAPAALPDRLLNRIAKTSGPAGAAPAAPAYDVVVMPFENPGNRDVVERVQDAVEKTFADHGFKVAPRGAKVAARYVVTGTIKQFRSNKKFRILGALVSPLSGSTTAYGTVELAAKVMEGERVAFENSVKSTQKKAFMGAYTAKGAMEDKALGKVAKELFGSFLEKK